MASGEHLISTAVCLENMIDLRKLLPNQQLQYLTCEFNDDVHNALKEYNLGWDVLYHALSKELIDQLHGECIKVNCWTVDNREDAERLADWGVDFITTNILE